MINILALVVLAITLGPIALVIIAGMLYWPAVIIEKYSRFVIPSKIERYISDPIAYGGLCGWAIAWGLAICWAVITLAG